MQWLFSFFGSIVEHHRRSDQLCCMMEHSTISPSLIGQQHSRKQKVFFFFLIGYNKNMCKRKKVKKKNDMPMFSPNAACLIKDEEKEVFSGCCKLSGHIL